MRVAQRLLAVCLAAAAALASAAEVIDDLAYERGDAGPVLRIRLAAPVNYVRHYPAESGRILVVVLDAADPDALGDAPPVDEVRRVRPGEGAPSVEVRVTRGERCGASAHPLCLALSFGRPVRYRLRLGEDHRSVVIEVTPPDGRIDGGRR